jgi:hypothetical protein
MNIIQPRISAELFGPALSSGLGTAEWEYDGNWLKCIRICQIIRFIYLFAIWKCLNMACIKILSLSTFESNSRVTL